VNTSPALLVTDNAANQADVAMPTPLHRACVIDLFDMHCGACGVLIENALTMIEGVSRARVHYATQRARVTFDPDRTSIEELLNRVEQLGYVAAAEESLDRGAIVRKQRHRHIWGFGLSAFCAMQVMMLTLPRFLAGSDMEPELAPLLDWAAFALVLPVIG
jgi:P-type Cu2+ transporter